MAKSKTKSSSKTKGKTKGKPVSKSAIELAALKAEVDKLRREIEEKNAVLQAYADHRNWVKPSEVRERLGIPAKDRSGKSIEEPTQCYVGCRYPWEPALKVMLGMAEAESEVADQ